MESNATGKNTTFNVVSRAKTRVKAFLSVDRMKAEENFPKAKHLQYRMYYLKMIISVLSFIRYIIHSNMYIID